MCDIMKKIFVFVCMLAMFMSVANAQWKPAGERIKTQWGEQLNPQNVLPDYPRPIMERSDWKNLIPRTDLGAIRCRIIIIGRRSVVGKR